MIPKDVLVAVSTGSPKFGWLKMSNISGRNCTLNRSVIFVFLLTEKSVFRKFGPTIVFLPRDPG